MGWLDWTGQPSKFVIYSCLYISLHIYKSLSYKRIYIRATKILLFFSLMTTMQVPLEKRPEIYKTEVWLDYFSSYCPMTHVKSNMLERSHLQTTIGTRSNMTCSVVLTCLLHFFPTEFRTLLSRIAPPSAPHNIQAQILIPQHTAGIQQQTAGAQQHTPGMQ
jgi:hypothetical protein